MINNMISERNIFESGTKAEFIVNVVNSESGVGTAIENLYPHVDIEYRKYIRYCKKNNITIAGTIQYVPSEVWAVGLVDTMKNDRIEKTNGDFKYFVNVFGQVDTETQKYNLSALRSTLNKVLDKARELNIKVAIHSSLYKLLHDYFDKSDIHFDVFYNWS